MLQLHSFSVGTDFLEVLPLMARKMKDMGRGGGLGGKGRRVFLDLNCVDKSLGDDAEASKAEQAN